MKRAYGSIWVISLLGLAACDDGSPPAIPVPDADRSGPDAYQPQAIDMGMRTTLTDGGMALERRYGAPCVTDRDCFSNICVPDGDGGICSASCLADCAPFPPGREASCRSDPSRGRIEFVCYPSQDLLCEPCIDDTQCDGAPCLETVDGRRCGRQCEGAGDCPAGFLCDAGNCSPVSGSCHCTPATAGTTRVCEEANEFGTCRGEETCEPEIGWTDCDAPEATAEICDGLDQNCNGIADDGIGPGTCALENEHGACEGVAICGGPAGERCYGTQPLPEVCDLVDNDCDDVVDEGFVDAMGRYADAENCGRCGVRCAGRIAFATAVRCDVDRDPPACVVLQCEPGYQALRGEACVPLRDVTCEACADDASCGTRSPGSACVTVGDPAVPETVVRVCGRDCGPESVFGQNCPDGFQCQAFREGDRAVHQCLPARGHCLCQGNAEGFSLPCAVTSPLNEALTCNGRRACEGGVFGACLLPAEACDGIDNDCDGVIDNGFRSDDGRYDLAPRHCGRCNFDCTMLGYANADGVCDQEVDTPICRMRCRPGFVDLDNGSDDGCECEVLAAEDHPDGVDRNCDGIDGDRSRALFVSKIGDDAAAGTVEAPMHSIAAALRLAAEPNARVRDIYVATGVYSENIDLVDGVNLYGGYALGFRTRDRDEHPTTILGRPPAGIERGTVTAIGLAAPTRVDGFDIYGANANVSGANSVTVFIADSGANFTLSNNGIIAGNGARGVRGGPGTPGRGGADAAVGAAAVTTRNSGCRNQATTGGRGGQNRCGAQDVSGGAGGSGHCPQSQRINGQLTCNFVLPNDCRNSCEEEPCQPLPPPQGVGASGQGVGQAPGGEATYDRWTNSGDCSLCGLFPALPHLGRPGAHGPTGPSGDAGRGCADPAGLLDLAFRWSTASGRVGQRATDGTGGGGGSAGSGLDTTRNQIACRDTLGGGGGGGGAGGCAGSGGAGGSGGGGAFGVLIVYGRGADLAGGLPLLLDNRIVRGVGGVGGSGGAGGIGGLGGEGAVGGISSRVFCAEPGGRGGNGGDAGHGGGGGGGCGGISVSVYVFGGRGLDAEDFADDNDLVDSGRAGPGGQGGGSTGNPGMAGVDGLVADVVERR